MAYAIFFIEREHGYVVTCESFSRWRYEIPDLEPEAMMEAEDALRRYIADEARFSPYVVPLANTRIAEPLLGRTA